MAIMRKLISTETDFLDSVNLIILADRRMAEDYSFSIGVQGLRYNPGRKAVFFYENQRKVLWKLTPNLVLDFLFDKTFFSIYLHNFQDQLLITGFKQTLSILQLDTTETIFEAQIPESPLKSIHVSDIYLVFPSSAHDLVLYDLSTLSFERSFKGHSSEVKKSWIQNKTLFSLSKDLIVWKFSGEIDFQLTEMKILDFCVCNKMLFLICCTGTKVTVWDLKSRKEVIFYSGCLVSQALTTDDQKFLVLSHYEVPMNNWHRVKRNFATLDIVEIGSGDLELRLPFQFNCKFLVYREKLVFVNEDVCSLWELRKIPELCEGVQMTAFAQSCDLAIIGSSEGAVYVFDLNYRELRLQQDVHLAEIFQIEVREDLIVSAGFDEKLVLTCLNDLRKILEICEPGICRFALQNNEVLTLTISGDLQAWNLNDGSFVKTIFVYSAQVQAGFNGLSIFNDTLMVTSKKMGVLVDRVKEYPFLQGIKPNCLTNLGKYFAVGCCDGPIFYWNLEQPDIGKILDNKDEIKMVSFHSSGQFLIYLVSNVARIWNFRIKRHVFSFEAKFASFLQGPGIFCCFCTYEFKIKVMEIRKQDFANVSRRLRFLMMFKRKFKLI